MRSRVIVALVSGLATLGAGLALAGPAVAATGPRYYSPEQAGYAATGARFQYVQSSVYLDKLTDWARARENGVLGDDAISARVSYVLQIRKDLGVPEWTPAK